MKSVNVFPSLGCATATAQYIGISYGLAAQQDMAWEISELIPVLPSVSGLRAALPMWREATQVCKGGFCFTSCLFFSGLISHVISVSSPAAAAMLPTTRKLY